MAETVQKHSPLEQFEVHPLVELEIGGIDISFTNSALMMVLAIMAVALYFTVDAVLRRAISWQHETDPARD